MSTSIPLRCPVTGAPLLAATPEDIKRINHYLETKPACVPGLQEIEGVCLSLPLTNAWITQTKTHAYLEQNGLPILLPDAAIALSRAN